ncbi:hypothetical protein E2C01_090168 [Portunus trituberculatus]|uniref:Uncharacterized protein n=1 Tax=Portunus trituberculatus TaxID=210409 RepID=A0A5B7JL45_PORTR|nr:hypothetical protein [Portunus trituberculatus]
MVCRRKVSRVSPPTPRLRFAQLNDVLDAGGLRWGGVGGWSGADGWCNIWQPVEVMAGCLLGGKEGEGREG